MAVVTDAYDKEPSKTKEATKNVVKQHLRKKYGRKAAKTGAKAVFKMIKLPLIIVSSLFGGILIPVICVTMITVMIVNMFGQVFNAEQYAQENPELVKYFLQNNYDEFETKVNSYVHDPEFISFVCNSEFDNGYTKLVYGGTSAYTQEELKGNYNGVQGQKANWVTYDKSKNKYYAQSVLNKIQDYIDSGVDVNNIKINDNYLKGYKEASGYGKKESLSFTQWINNSYYTIPFYYHFNMAKNSDYVYPSSFLGYIYEGTKGGLPNWFQEINCGSWGFMKYATTDGKAKSNDGIAGYPNVSRQIWSNVETGKGNMAYSKINYANYLKTGWMSFKPNKSNAGNISGSRYEKDYSSGNCYYAKGVMLGYNMYVLDNWFEKGLNSLWNKDESYGYQPFSPYYTHKAESKYDKSINNLYVYDWFNKKSGKQTNYEKYIMNVKDVNTVSKREDSNGNSIVNTNIESWLNNFAEYFAKEIYYVYPNRQYIIDYFLNNDNSEKMKHKRIAFLQRSFYAMATGSALDVNLDEEYNIEGGKVGSVLTESNVGSLDINKLSIDAIEYLEYSDSTGTSKISSLEDASNKLKEAANNLSILYSGKGESLEGKTFEASFTYKAKIKTTYKTNKNDEYFYVPVKNVLTVDMNGNVISNKLIFNAKGYKLTKAGNNNKKLKSLVTFSWDKDYRESQYTYDNEGTVKNKNPLDSIDVNKDLKIKEYVNKEWDVTCLQVGAEDVQKALNTYCNKQAKQSKTSYSPLFHLFAGSIKGKREVKITYTDHSFLNYDIAEKKDANGKVTSVIIEIFTYYPDLSKYGDDEYRVAYGFENGDALQQAFNLLQYTQANADKQIGGKNEGKTLEGLNEKVDFTKLLVSENNDSYVDTGGIYSESDVYSYIATILAEVESSNNWGSVAKPYANSSGEKTITAGAYQFYGENAHTLLRNICKNYKKESLKYISDSLYKDIVSDTNWESTYWKPKSDSDYTSISKLIKTEFGIKCQKELMAKRAKGYVDLAVNTYKITDMKVQVYFAVMYHQSPKQTKAVVSSFSKTTITLDALHSARANNGVLCNYVNRYNTTYKFCQNITSMKGIKGDIAKVLQYAQSDRVVGKKYSNARSDFLNSNGLPSAKKYKATYDCSEFVACCYYYGMGFDFGKNYTASSMEEYLEEKGYTVICSGSVDTNKLQPGDIMFFNASNGYNKGAHGIGHVAIYLKDGKCVEAGDPVGTYNVVGRKSLYKAYRIVNSQKKNKK